MAEVKCPNCGTVISLAQSEIDAVVRQVRDEEFEREVAKRLQVAEAEKKQAVRLAEETLRAKQAQESADKDAQIAQLRTQLESDAKAAAAREQLAVAQAVSAVEKERDSLRASIEIAQAEKSALEAGMKEKLAEQERLREQMLALKDEEIERLKDLRARQSTKMIGESLEVHCMNEFNKVRAMAFPNAYFERDTETVEGTKGDFIFREFDEDGTEIISIMFEMKNESDSDSRKLRNEDHFAKLDRDRTKKGCEFAVLVSLLEPESELYNDGIVDVSYRYPKMYVVRPQFFLAIISLLRQGALASLQYRREVALMKRQELDITHFEDDLDTFKQGFFKNFGDASKRFEEAIAAIDKAIADLQKVKDKLTASEKHLTAANHKLEGLTVKKLTRGNPTMKEKFAALAEADDSDE